MSRRSIISKLDKSLQAWLESELIERGFSEYTELTDAFNERLSPLGFTVSRSAIHSAGKKIQRQLEAVKNATMSAKLIAKEAADEGADLNGAVNSLLSTEMFGLLTNLAALGDNDSSEDKVKRMEIVAKMSKASADLSRAAVSQKKYAAQVHEQIEQKLKVLEAKAKATGGKAKGLDKATLARVRQELYGIVS